MSYNSVAEIYDDIDGARAKLMRAVEELDEEQRAFRPSPEKWSVTEIVEHLSIVEGQVAALLEKLLGKAEAGGHVRAEGSAFQPVSIAEQIEQVREKRLTAPEQIRPTGAQLDASLAAMRSTRDSLRNLRTRVERVDGTTITFPHPAFGPINLYQWLAFIGAHELRHLAQIESLKAAMSAES